MEIYRVVSADGSTVFVTGTLDGARKYCADLSEECDKEYSLQIPKAESEAYVKKFGAGSVEWIDIL